MSDFKPGDKVLIEALLVMVAGDRAVVDFYVGDSRPASLNVPFDRLRAAPDPELRPGMVVAAVDPADDREWWVAEGADSALGFLNADGEWFTRDQLDCARLRIVHPRVNP